MATSRQRRRELARLKYERQSVRRYTRHQRERKLAIAGGVALAVLGVIGLVWLIVHLAKDDSNQPTTPAPSFTLPPNTLITPSEPITPTPTRQTQQTQPTKSAAQSQHPKPSEPSTSRR